MERTVTIRFSHCDAAGLVFYPRFFEILGELFEAPPFHATPFAMETNFRRPNVLGDEVTVVYAESGGSGWSFSGRMDGNEHFSIAQLPAGHEALDATAHAPDVAGFRSRPVKIAPWTTDCSGRLQVSRFFELLNLAVEQWFAESLGWSFAELHNVRQRCIPTVVMRTRCRELPKAGDEVEIWVRPTKIGRRSMTYNCYLVRDNECLMDNEQVVVFVEAGGPEFVKIDIPESIRARLEEQYVAA